MEGWEDVDGSLASIERALQVLTEQLPEKVKSTAGHVGWMFLTMLHRSMEEVLTKATQIQDRQPRWEALEVRVCQLEEKLHSGDSEAEAADVNGSDVAPHPHAQLIVQQKVKHEQPLGPGGIAASNPAVTEFTTYTPYTPTELQELGR
ncbi:hypothetical protein mRhiFer1_008896 [Rhinolophus ferrumequinum]|uniref:Uncharacterized protein n=1 Tax=Rhinolophus ferrumequinum TaxID=59479 RepID=A0A7J7TDP8_RHIFE|nr:hypothetical protein mRhiFer1_008896 [Rhinolophus ferrumequinum]